MAVYYTRSRMASHLRSVSTNLIFQADHKNPYLDLANNPIRKLHGAGPILLLQNPQPSDHHQRWLSHNNFRYSPRRT